MISIAVVIPAYKVKDQISSVVSELPSFVDHIIVIDDKCPEYSGKIAESLSNKKVIVIYHEVNKGVGGAVISGYKKAVELGVDIIIKIDGDGQMDVNYMHKLIKPIIDNKADYTKGNRFFDFKDLHKMPKIRLIGNSGLSFLVKAASGYWNIMDPTNGYTAIHRSLVEDIDLEKIAKRYFFESDMLINLNIENAVVVDVPIPARYGDEKSSLSITRTLFGFPPKIVKGFCKRVLFKYFIYDFNMASVYLVMGVPMVIFGSLYGLYHWISSSEIVQTPIGTVMLSVLPIILGTQFLLQAIQIDMNNQPKRNL